MGLWVKMKVNFLFTMWGRGGGVSENRSPLCGYLGPFFALETTVFVAFWIPDFAEIPLAVGEVTGTPCRTPQCQLLAPLLSIQGLRFSGMVPIYSVCPFVGTWRIGALRK